MTRRLTIQRAVRSAAITIMSAIDANPLSRNDITELVPDIHVGRNQLLREFKIVSGGKTIRRYRLEKRMEAAQVMLATGTMSIKEVAIECGYKKPNYFSAEYKEIFGITPNEYLVSLFGDDLTVTL